VSYRPALDLSGFATSAAASPDQEDWFNRPLRSGPPSAPLECTSSQTLTVLGEVIFDVNGYYRAFGFEFPYTDVTRKALRLAYHDLRGEESVWLTAVLRQLLDPAKKRAYDCAPYGERHLDEVEQARVISEVKREAARKSRGQGVRATMDDLLAKMGLAPEPENSNGQSPEGEDNEPPIVHTEDLPLDHHMPWSWGYYRWNTGRSNTDRLGQWQEMLVSQLAAQEVSIKFCVGFIGRGRTDSRFVVARTYGVRTVYLREDLEPDREMAAAAVASLLADE
jgi:hypothetical protein